MTNNHYLAVKFSQDLERDGIFLAPRRSIMGSLYAPSRKKAQEWLDDHHPGLKALLASSCKDLPTNCPVLWGSPRNNDRNAGRKSTGHSIKIQLNGLSDQALAKLTTEAAHSNRSAYVVGLIEADVINRLAR